MKSEFLARFSVDNFSHSVLSIVSLLCKFATFTYVIVSSLSPPCLISRLFWAFAFKWLDFMVLYCAAVNWDSVSFSFFSFSLVTMPRSYHERYFCLSLKYISLEIYIKLLIFLFLLSRFLACCPSFVPDIQFENNFWGLLILRIPNSVESYSSFFSCRREFVFTNPSQHVGCDTRSIFAFYRLKFIFLLLDWLSKQG